jgi:hypothetical protein
MTSLSTTPESHISQTPMDEVFTPANIRALAGCALEYMKSKYSKSSITASEAFIEFMQYKRENKEQETIYLQLLCLAMSMINQTEAIEQEIRDKMITGMIKRYVENI